MDVRLRFRVDDYIYVYTEEVCVFIYVYKGL